METRRRLIGREVSSSHSRPASNKLRESAPRVAVHERDRRLPRPAGPRVPERMPRRTLSVSIASPSSKVSARSTLPQAQGVCLALLEVGPFSHAWRRSRSLGDPRIDLGLASAPSAGFHLITASSDAWTVDVGHVTPPLPSSPKCASHGFSGTRVYASAAGQRLEAPGDASAPGQVEPGRLELGVAVEGVEPLVAAEARLLVAAERDRDVGRRRRC